MSKEEEVSFDDSWILLHQNRVFVPKNLKHILVTHGVVGIRVLADINENIVKELERSVRELGSPDMSQQMSREEIDLLFGMYALQPHQFRFSIGDKMVLRVISKVCKQIVDGLEISSNVKAPCCSKGLSTGEQDSDTSLPNVGSSNNLPVASCSGFSLAPSILRRGNTSNPSSTLTLEEFIIRWGWEKNLKCENNFKLKGDVVVCKFKTSVSSYCNKSFKVQQSPNGTWVISNFTNHVNAYHSKFQDTSKVTTVEDPDLVGA